MQRTGYYTGKKVYASHFNRTVTIGKISGFRGTGEPVYDLMEHNKKIGEMGNPEIKKNRLKMKEEIKNL